MNEEAATRSLERIPALDGVRAVAVALVLFFHGGWSWMPAGYLGVSVFFTLSGFLITRLLLAEFSSTGRIGLGRFTARRLRRLVPASVLTLLLILVARGFGAYGEVPRLRLDLIAAATETFNWVRLAGTTSYADLFSGVSASTVSPVEHFWSLAIEEQFYLLWPLIMLGVLRAAMAGRGSATRSILLITGAAVIMAPLVAVWFGPEAAYWATTARLAEILLGASLAAVLHSGLRIPARAASLAPIALGLIVTFAVIWPSDGGPAYEGWLPAFALLSTALIAGLLVPSRLGSLLASRPFVWVGGISYGLYLFHWPVFTLLRERGWILDQIGPFVIATAIAVGLAALSSRLLEIPVRELRWAPRPTVTWALSGIFAIVVVAFVTVPSTRSAFDVDQELLAQAAIQPADSLAALEPLERPQPDVTGSSVSPPPTAAADTSTAVSTAPPSPTVSSVPEAVALSRPVRILVVGDSTAQSVGEGLASWAVDNPQTASVSVVTSQGFGFVTSGTITSWDGDPFVERSIAMLADDIPNAISELQPDVVLLMATVNDVTDRIWAPGEEPRSPVDAGVSNLISAEYERSVAAVGEVGDAALVWVIPPVPTTEWEAVEMRDEARYRVQHGVIEAVAAGGDAVTADLDSWMVSEGLVDDPEWRPDGTHLSRQGAATLAESYLGPLLVQVALDARAIAR